MITSKVEDRQPLYHLEKKSQGTGESPLISRQSMAEWFIATANVCQPIINLLADEVSEHGIAATFEIIQKHIFARDLGDMIQYLLDRQVLKKLFQEGSSEYFDQVLNYLLDTGEIKDLNEFFEELRAKLPKVAA